MQKFAYLCRRLEMTKSTSEKVRIVQVYFEEASPQDAIWALFFLSGKKIKRLITARMLFAWCKEILNLPEWLMDESYAAVGDVSETIALLMASKKREQTSQVLSLSEWIEQRILPLQGKTSQSIKEQILACWQELDLEEMLVLNKILSGSLRIGVSHLLTIKALSQALNINTETLNQKLMGSWFPSVEFFQNLKSDDLSVNLNPYPFFLASPIDTSALPTLGPTSDWIAEWKWDGIRAQCIHRQGVAIWSRGNELVTHQFPEIEKAIKDSIDEGTVLDGEILAYDQKGILPFGMLQQRLGRKKISATLLNQVPVIFMIYDLLEYQGNDIRHLPFCERRAFFAHWDNLNPSIKVSPTMILQSWEEVKHVREQAKDNGTEGLILKKITSSYGIGRKRGSWWKFKIDPKTIDAILIYAQTGQGWRANLYTDYTFAVWQDQELVPIAKAYSGLTQLEIYELDKWIRKNTVEKFGPVRKVKSEQVFEIAFEGIVESKRHKSGLALRFPRIQRWRKDKPIIECDTVPRIKSEFLQRSG